MTEVSEGRLNADEPNSLTLTSETMACMSFGPAVSKVEFEFSLYSSVHKVMFASLDRKKV